MSVWFGFFFPFLWDLVMSIKKNPNRQIKAANKSVRQEGRKGYADEEGSRALAGELAAERRSRSPPWPHAGKSLLHFPEGNKPRPFASSSRPHSKRCIGFQLTHLGALTQSSTSPSPDVKKKETVLPIYYFNCCLVLLCTCCRALNLLGF